MNDDVTLSWKAIEAIKVMLNHDVVSLESSGMSKDEWMALLKILDRQYINGGMIDVHGSKEANK